MSEEENLSVEEQSSTAVAPAEESTDTEQEVQETQEQRQKRNDVEYNWAAMNRLVKEKDREVAELKEQLSSVNKKAAPVEEDELARLAEDDILTVAQARKLATKMARQTAEQLLKERDASTVDERVQIKFPDYSATVTRENIEILKETEPELARSLYHMSDPFEQAVVAYKYIKKFVPQRDTSMTQEKKKALENSKKPVSVQSAAKQSAIGNAHHFENGLTPELKSQLWKEMQDVRKGA